MVVDRSRLRYLNAFEQGNCVYCSYANGLIAYVGVIIARTEQHWCPIKHAEQPRAPHARYPRFLPYGDAHAYRDHIEDVRHDFGATWDRRCLAPPNEQQHGRLRRQRPESLLL